MSTRKGAGATRTRKPKHQNTFAFRHNPKSQKTAKILASVNAGLCASCHDKVEWRKRYRKYRPLRQPATCNDCHKKTITSAYHKICTPCARERRVCPWCCTKGRPRETSEDGGGEGGGDERDGEGEEEGAGKGQGEEDEEAEEGEGKEAGTDGKGKAGADDDLMQQEGEGEGDGEGRVSEGEEAQAGAAAGEEMRGGKSVAFTPSPRRNDSSSGAATGTGLRAGAGPSGADMMDEA